MKKTKRLFSLMLAFAFLFSTFEIVKFSASTTDTRYSLKHIQNGNFEENVDKYTFSSNYSQPDKTKVPYWDTTAYEGKFEFFKSTSAHFNITRNKYPNNPEYLNVADGDVAAELNADEESTIYQRINTVAGSTYTWGLYHRGRDTTDRMVLIIGPEQPVDPSKPSKTGEKKDQFVRITHWLKNQYGVDYPEKGCSKKYTVYTKPFANSGKFVDEDTKDEDKNISLIETDEINQEWSVWVISSPECNTDPDTTTVTGINKINSVNGWSAYGTNSINDFDDIIKGASSSLDYDCTYTVPKGQTNTIFAFCSYSSGRSSGNTVVAAPTYGNLLDGIKFDLYQPVSSSITPGGIGGAETDDIKITSDIKAGNSMHSVIRDGELCTLYTKKYEETLTDCTFTGAYVTVNNADGTSVTTFRETYDGDISNLTAEEIKELAKTYFIKTDFTDADGETWNYYTRISVESPVSVHLIYTKAPFVLYDSNGGKEYYFSPTNEDGGNLVGFGNSFQKVFHKNPDGEIIYVDTSNYYINSHVDEETGAVTQMGFYKSHAALQNENWVNGSAKFCGWSVLDNSGNQIILNGEHTVTYDPTKGTGGIVSFKDGENVIDNLQLDATHGVTLTALWKFVNRAQAQTYNNETGEYEDSAVGGYVEETLIPNDLRGSDVNESYQTVDGKSRIVRVDAAADAGDKIMFKATSDYKNDYVFKGWYCKVKQADGTYKEELRSVSSSIAVTVEEGKLNTYYARFQKNTLPVVFKYTPTGSVNDYDFYEKSADYTNGKYYQNVTIGDKAVKPTGDSESVTTWYTSPDKRDSAYIFDFNTPITQQTVLYAGPSFTFNYFNEFTLNEPWQVYTYGTLKLNNKYIDLKNDSNVTDYNLYMLKGTVGQDAPSATSIKNNKNTVKITRSSDKLIYNTVTNTGKTFNRAGTLFNDFYLFNMKTPVWVVFDFTYKGVKYTSTVNDRSLYNNITTYLAEAENGFYTTFPPETQAELRDAQTKLLLSIQDMYDAFPNTSITQPSQYADCVKMNGLKDKPTYDPSTDGTYEFTSSTAIRNIEPWGLKYSFTVNGKSFSDFDDYGAVILTDKAGYFDECNITKSNVLNDGRSVLYSKSNNNIYSGDNGAIDIYYINNMYSTDFNKYTYAVFFVKDSDGKYYYSDPVKNSYNSIASKDTSEYADVSKSIMNYSNAFIRYTKLVEQAKKQ